MKKTLLNQLAFLLLFTPVFYSCDELFGEEEEPEVEVNYQSSHLDLGPRFLHLFH